MDVAFCVRRARFLRLLDRPRLALGSRHNRFRVFRVTDLAESGTLSSIVRHSYAGSAIHFRRDRYPKHAEIFVKTLFPRGSQSGGGAANNSEAHALLARLMDIARASALEEMASGLAHELNQPLGAIATYSQAAERMLTKSPPMLDAALDAMRQVSKEALGAGDGIRRIRRLFNREMLEKIPCSIGAILHELEPLLSILGDQSGAKFQIEIAPGVPNALADPLRIQHVLFTLIQNAFEARRGARQPNVKVTVASDRYSVEVAVTDNGTGIPEEFHGQIFKPFYTTKTNGTGLGLASSRAIVEMHEGTIGFKSSPDGSRFWFSLPAHVEPKGLAQL